MRVLAATTAGAGHFAGLIPFARACARAGHEVRVAAPASFAQAVERAGFVHEPVGDPDPAALGAVLARIPELPVQVADDLAIQEIFGRLNRDAALPGVRAALDRWRPDVVLREPAEVASYVAATERGIPHVQTNIGLCALDDRLLPLFADPLDEVGCSPDALAAALRWTVLPPSFDQPADRSTGPVTYARDPESQRRSRRPLPGWWSGFGDEPLVYVTFGSVTAEMGLFPEFYARVLKQLADVPARALLTVGPAGEPADLGAVPSNVHVERWWPQDDVLPHAGLVVGHGGFGTTQAALVAAVPQVVLPLFSFDQFLDADRAAAVGVGVALVDGTAAERRDGLVVPRGPAATDRLAAAVSAVLEQPAYAERARVLAEEVQRLPDADDVVATLAVGSASSSSPRPAGQR